MSARDLKRVWVGFRGPATYLNRIEFFRTFLSIVAPGVGRGVLEPNSGTLRSRACGC